MENQEQRYGWTDYYRTAYEREKQNNAMLAAKVAEAESRVEDLAFALNRIQGNRLWRLSAPFRKGWYLLFNKEGRTALRDRIAEKTDKKSTSESFGIQIDDPAYLAYRDEVFRQKHAYLQWLMDKEQHINNECYAIKPVNTGIVVNGWQEIYLEEMDCHVFLFGQGYLDETAKEKIKSYFNNHKGCLMAYVDEDYFLDSWNEKNNRFYPWFKPDWSPDTMLAFCYIGHVLIMRESFCRGAGLSAERDSSIPNPNYEDCETRFYDLCLRAEEAVLSECGNDYRKAAKRIGHIKDVLFHNLYKPDEMIRRQLSEAKNRGEDVFFMAEQCLREELEKGRDMAGADEAGARVREAALQRRGIDAKLYVGPDPGIFHIAYEPSGKISVVIPSKDHPDVLEKCLSSFREKTGYKDYEWIVVDNGSGAENKEAIRKLQEEYGFHYLYEPMEFNFSAMCNLGAKKASGDYLLFLNDDVEIIEADWLAIMLGQAMRPYAGAVGAKLWYAGSDWIQHAGITNLKTGPSHKLMTFTDDKNYYYGRNKVTYNMIGVTGACLMVAKSKFREVGGMDESMKVVYNDVDLCFKLAAAGYYNVVRNDAVLYHYESLSRGLDAEDDGKWERLLLGKEKLYGKHPYLAGKDPFYHEGLIDGAAHYGCSYKFDFEDHLKTLEVQAESTERIENARENLLQLTVDCAVKQHKMNRDEPEIMLIMGWCYLPGEDNAQYVKTIILRHEDGTLCSVIPFSWWRPDVEAILSEETHISLAGFVARIREESLQSGNWEVGVMAESVDGKKRFLTWSGKGLHVDAQER